MSLSRLEVTHVRNLHRVKLQELRRINLFHGRNGSGKTSVLESVHLLGMARSFRGNRIGALISHGESSCTVFGTVAVGESHGATPLGVQRSAEGETRIRVGGESVRAVSQLAAYLPLQVINAGSFDLLTGAPGARRQFLDWGLFHVEQPFMGQWQRFQRCIKQRNKLLRRGKIRPQELQVWTRELADAGNTLSEARQRYHATLEPVFQELAALLAPELEQLELRFRRGWDKQLSYAEALAAGLKSDQEQGFTHAGPQRADLRLLTGGRLAADTLSRGQQKLVICAMKLAQGQVLTNLTGRRCIYLVDDLPSELDREHCGLVCGQLAALGAQVFITCVDRDDVLGVWPDKDPDLAVFHVEHGQMTRA